PLLFTTILLLLTLFLTLPIFRIKEIEIHGVNHIPIEKIYAASGISENQHFLSGMGGSLKDFFSGTYSDAEQQVLSKIPEVKDIKIYFSFPSRITFEVEEKIEIGFIKIPDGYCTIDSNGEVVSLLKTLPDALPIIEGIVVKNATVGKRIEVLEEEYLINAMYAMTALIEADYLLDGEKLINNVKKIEATINEEIFLTLQLDDKEFLIQSDRSHDLVSDFIWLKQIINEGTLSNVNQGIIDLRGKHKTFRESYRLDIKENPTENLDDNNDDNLDTSAGLEETESTEIETSDFQ
ncbi:MAG: FtsQ-type POTRA domain-containing protein, partial [Clostridiaceae bacterium]|nr:FtsQ-type POTRA domain-containing protein [Clostridiaceae bacterium]